MITMKIMIDDDEDHDDENDDDDDGDDYGTHSITGRDLMLFSNVDDGRRLATARLRGGRGRFSPPRLLQHLDVKNFSLVVTTFPLLFLSIRLQELLRRPPFFT